jgi:uncharacterized protein
MKHDDHTINPARGPVLGLHVGPGFSRAESISNATKAQPARTPGSFLLISGIHVYRLLLAPFLGGNCKFYPSCSHYAEEAVRIHGARRGIWLALKRLLRCHPFTKGGVDLVPEPEECEFPLHGQEHLR